MELMGNAKQLLDKYSNNFSHLRILDNINTLYKQSILEALTPDGRYISVDVNTDDIVRIERYLKDWSPNEQH